MKNIIALIIVTVLGLFVIQPVSSIETKQLTFRAKKSDLWFEHPNISKDNNSSSLVEVELTGEIYKEPITIKKDISKKEANSSTLVGAVESYFAANGNADAVWIVENYLDEEKEDIEKLFNNGALLEKHKRHIENIEKIEITGKAMYKDYIIVFIKQKFISGKVITEAIPFKRTEEGYKVTNSLGKDDTYDIVFAALAFGNVTDENGNVLDNKQPPLGTLVKPKIRVVK